MRIARIRSTTFPYKTVLSKVNVKTNSVESTKWTYQKEQSFVTKFHIFFEKFSLSVRTSYNNWCNAPATLISIFILFGSVWALVQCAFSMWVSLNIYNQWNKILTRLNLWNNQLINWQSTFIWKCVDHKQNLLFIISRKFLFLCHPFYRSLGQLRYQNLKLTGYNVKNTTSI